MHDGEPSKEAQRHAHAIQEVFQEVQVCPQSMIEVAVVHHIDSFAFVELTFYIK